MDNGKSSNPLMSLPGAIILAGVIIAGAIFLTSGNSFVKKVEVGDIDDRDRGASAASLDKMDPITSADHILGSPDAPVKIVVYSDLECPFCKLFHEGTILKVADQYSKTGKVAIVFRHFPLDNLHSKARKEAAAAECAAQLGGNDAFWKYVNKIYEITPSNNGLDLAKLPEIAAGIGLDSAAFNICLESGQFDQRIQKDFQNAIATGGNGTPWSIIIDPDGKAAPINGMVDFGYMKAVVDSMI
ncbi:MAG: hypothetical protein A3H68_00265 [Candidatus Taylorbacteria bacterium RIFCSPLOWO2_02_FULL_46_40]|uniref:Thioredoxin-like fold domain-containing protein n=2 Tax=Candidatus Tayloriibacteriota TaxID=1817919 RepID=A0A1G2NXL5_9BACT|nr:MAG: hypothetical protein A3H68_00265 [Candidatus Taylorbacteria bacterium RIFCSPLOWO2_02_FULL_46_40]